MVILQLGDSYPLQNSKAWDAPRCPTGHQYPWAACVKTNLFCNWFYRKDDPPPMIKTHCLLSPLFNQHPESAKKCLSWALPMPHIRKSLQCWHLFSRGPTQVGSHLLCSWRKTGSTQFVVSEQRQPSSGAAAQAVSVAHSLSRSIILAHGRTFARSRLLGPLLFVCLFSPSAWSGLVFSCVKNKNIHWETFAGLI